MSWFFSLFGAPTKRQQEFKQQLAQLKQHAKNLKFETTHFPHFTSDISYSVYCHTNALPSTSIFPKLNFGCCFAIQNCIFAFVDYAGSSLFVRIDTLSWRVKHLGTTALVPTAMGATCVVGHVVYLFGGVATNNKHLDNVLRKWNSETGELVQVKATGPPEVSLPCIVHRTRTNSLLLFGGCGKMGLFQNTIWSFDLYTDTWKLEEQQNNIPARYGKTTVYDAITDSLYVFGGILENVISDMKVHHFSFASRCWTEVATIPCDYAASNQGLAVHTLSDTKVVVLLCAHHSVPHHSYIFDLHTRTWQGLTIPHGISSHMPSCSIGEHSYALIDNNKVVVVHVHNLPFA